MAESDGFALVKIKMNDDFFKMKIQRQYSYLLHEKENIKQIWNLLVSDDLVPHSIIPGPAILTRVVETSTGELALNLEYVKNPESNAVPEAIPTEEEGIIEQCSDEAQHDVLASAASVLEDAVSPPKKRVKVSTSTPIQAEAPTPPSSCKSRKSLFSTELSSIPTIVKTESVKVKNLPENFSEEILLYVITTALVVGGKCEGGTQPVTVVEKGKIDATVKFTSVEAASYICSQPLTYLTNKLEFDQVVLESDPCDATIPTPQVKVSNLPEGFSNEVLLYLLNGALGVKGGCKAAIEVVHANEDCATVKFLSVKHATEICSKDVKYGLRNLNFEQITKEPMEPLPLAPPTPEVVSVPTNRVTVSNLPNDFCEAILLYELNNALLQAGLIEEGSVGASKVVETKGSTVVVECISVELAESLVMVCVVSESTKDWNVSVLMQRPSSSPPPAVRKSSGASSGFIQDLCNLSLGEEIVENVERVEVAGFADYGGADDFTEDEYTAHVAAKTNTDVLFRNVPHAFDERAFKEVVETALEMQFPELQQVYEPLIGDVIHNPEDKTVRAQFSSCELANMVSQLKVIDYLDCRMAVAKLPLDGAVGTSPGSDSSDVVVTLQDDDGRDAFLRLLIKYRDEFPKSGSHDSVLEKLRKKLAKKGVTASIGEMRVKKTRLRESYNRMVRGTQPASSLFKPFSVAFGGETYDCLKTTAWEVEESEDDDTEEEDAATHALIKFSAGACFSNNSSKALLQVCLDHREEYESHKGNVRFWRKISAALSKKNYYYTGDKCRAEVLRLTSNLKTYESESERTGAAGPLQIIPNDTVRELMTLTKELNAKNVAVHPKYVLGAGVKTYEKKDQDAPTKGRNRSSILTGKSAKQARKDEREERRLKADETIASALDKLADSIANKNKS